MGRDKCLLTHPISGDSWAAHAGKLIKPIVSKLYISLHPEQADTHEYQSLNAQGIFEGFITDEDFPEISNQKKNPLFYSPSVIPPSAVINEKNLSGERTGPVSGILSAHIKYPEADWLILAADMINMQPNILEELVKAYHANQLSAYYAYRSEQGIEPLAAIYTSAGLTDVLKNRQVQDFAQIGPSQWLKSEKALILKSPLDECFANMNYPADLL
jgi:molybdopterin-guanine dinucleotide biosynthesis protein A